MYTPALIQDVLLPDTIYFKSKLTKEIRNYKNGFQVNE